MKVDVILGLQWGDEGKGVDCLAGNYGMVARFQGGPNAGHTLIIDGKKSVLHQVPSGIYREGIINFIGNGVVLDPVIFGKELDGLDESGTDYKSALVISKKVHLILPTHRLLDQASEKAKGKQKIGSTLKGIGPTYMDKTGRNGLRIGDTLLPDFMQRYEALRNKHLKLLKLYPEFDMNLEALEKEWLESLDRIRALKLVDGEYFVNDFLKSGKRILAEGAQGSMLDIDFGTYPFVTSSNTITTGVCTGLGVSPHHIGEVIGITKAYCTRVGSGPFPTELHGEVGEELRRVGHEFGATTGRPRRCGWIDIPQLKYTIMLNGVTQLALTKVDVLNDFAKIGIATAYSIEGTETDRVVYDYGNPNVKPVFTEMDGWQKDLNDCLAYEEFPEQTQRYLAFLERELDTPIKLVSTGPDRTELVQRELQTDSV